MEVEIRAGGNDLMPGEAMIGRRHTEARGGASRTSENIEFNLEGGVDPPSRLSSVSASPNSDVPVAPESRRADGVYGRNLFLQRAIKAAGRHPVSRSAGGSIREGGSERGSREASLSGN